MHIQYKKVKMMSERIYAGRLVVELGILEHEHIQLIAELSRINSRRVILCVSGSPEPY